MKEIVLNHPLITHKLSILRDKETGTKQFREIISEISILLCLGEDEYAFVPILRAGMSMVDGIIKVIPNAKIGHIGLYRDKETLLPVEYYYKMPENINKREVFILDPMLATGGSAIATIDRLKKDGVKKIKFLCVLAAPEGIKKVKDAHKDVQIYCACVDEKLNEHSYIVPGLGDAGDRVYGTK